MVLASNSTRHAFVDHRPAHHKCDRRSPARYALWDRHTRSAQGRVADCKDPAFEATFAEPPETPAPVFAVRAFKHALFGTPAPDAASSARDAKAKQEVAKAKTTELGAQTGGTLPPSPTKPSGILMTPGTTTKGRKTVTFGAQVVDNEGKKGAQGSRSGLPNGCPGKFPSPWTAETMLQADKDRSADKRARTKLTGKLYDVRSASQAQPGRITKSKDDLDITLDMMEPRSESGKYWKERFQSYALNSEGEMKRLANKQQLAKHFARKKDSEVTELETRLTEERKRHKTRERELEEQNKELQERLRQAMAENLRATTELATLKKRFDLPGISSAPTTGQKNALKPREEADKDPSPPHEEQNKDAPSTIEAAEDVPLRPSIRITRVQRPGRSTPIGKDYPHPMRRKARRSSSDEAAALSTGEQGVLASLAANQLPSIAVPAKASHAAAKENVPPMRPAVVHSPAPRPALSLDPWMQAGNDSPIAPMDKNALPLASAPALPLQCRGQVQDNTASSKAAKMHPSNSACDVVPVAHREKRLKVMNPEQRQRAKERLAEKEKRRALGG